MALSHDVLLEELQKLMVQRESGALSGEEFEQYAAALLSGSVPPSETPHPRSVMEARPQSTMERPPRRQSTAWTATPTSVPTVAAEQPPPADPTDEALSGSVPTARSPRPKRTRGTAWSAVPGPNTTPNQSSPGSNLWSAVPASGTTAAPPDPARPDLALPDPALADLATPDHATPDLATPDLATPDLEPVAGPSRGLNGQGRKSAWAAQPQAPTEAPQLPSRRERGRRRLRRGVDPDSKLVSDHPPTAPSPEVKTGSEVAAPAANGPGLSARAGVARNRPTSAFTALPTAAAGSTPVVKQAAPPKGKGKGRLLRRASRPAVRSSESVGVDALHGETAILPPQAAEPGPPEVTPNAETAVETKSTDGLGERRRSRGRLSFSAIPNADTSEESAEAEVPEETSVFAQQTIPDVLEATELIVSESAGSMVEAGAVAAEEDAPIALEKIEELLVPEGAGSDLVDETATAEIAGEFRLSIEVSAEELPAPLQGAPSRDFPAASPWVFQPDPVAEVPGPAPKAETTKSEVSSLAPAESRAPRRHRKTGKHSQQKKRRDKHAAAVIEEVPPQAEVLTIEPERDEGPLPASYWDHSRRILPELRPVGDDDGAPGIAPFSYWDLSNRILAPAPESDDEAQLDPEGYWSRSIKE
jgi:hypothetical protein